MRYYQEIMLIQQPEISLYFIWSKLYMQLHLAFVEHKNEQEKIPYGVSFPQYCVDKKKESVYLGTKIRIFAHSEEELQQLDLHKWCRRLTDYVHISGPREVPQKKITGYAHYFRYNPKINMEDRIRRQAQRHHVSLNEARKYFADYAEKMAVINSRYFREELPDGEIAVECPWQDQYDFTAGQANENIAYTVYLPKGLAGREQSDFKCLHASHGKKSLQEFLDKIEYVPENFTTIESNKYVPYINLHSLSRHSLFRLYIARSTATEEVGGLFGTYGLSQTATVPEF